MIYEAFSSSLLLFGGVYLLLALKGKLQILPDATKNKEWIAKYATAMKWSGWVTAVWGALRLIRAVI